MFLLVRGVSVKNISFPATSMKLCIVLIHISKNNKPPGDTWSGLWISDDDVIKTASAYISLNVVISVTNHLVVDFNHSIWDVEVNIYYFCHFNFYLGERGSVPQPSLIRAGLHCPTTLYRKQLELFWRLYNFGLENSKWLVETN